MPSSSSSESKVDLEAQVNFRPHTVIEEVPRHAGEVGRIAHSGAANRFPAEFRTLSIHVDTLKDATPTAGKAGKTQRLDVKDLAELDWHKISIDDALQRLAVFPKTGLDNAQARRRQQANGKNRISPPKSNLWRKVLEWVLGGFGSLLLAASIVCFIAWKPLGEPNPQASNLALAVVLLIVLVIQAIFNAWQDFSTSRVMSSIKGMLPSDVLVIRDAVQTKVPAEELVTGDLVYMTMGEKVPADLKLIEVTGDLQFDRSILTGESEPVSGRLEMTDENILETKNIALQGTHCVGGSGLGLVVQTGDRTIFGRIAKLSSAEPNRLTTLQWEILRFVAIIAGLATAVAVIMVIIWAAWLRRSFPSYINVPTLLIDVVSVMVAFIPEGLPVAVTLSLAKVANTLSKHKVLCKSLSIVETLGSVDIICSDKTGTLTQNKMTVEDVAVLETTFDVPTYERALQDQKSAKFENLRQLAAVGAICNSASYVDGFESKEERMIVGDATDIAMFRFSNLIFPAEVMQYQWTEVYRISFSSKSKFMLKLSMLSPDTPLNTAPLASWDKFSKNDFLLTVKGAPEVLMHRCTFAINPSGGPPIPMTTEIQERISAVQEEWAGSGKRVLLLARKVIPEVELPSLDDKFTDDFIDAVEAHNDGLVFVGLAGLIDPLKPDIKRTVQICRGAGIRFFVVTGDHPTTAVAIARNAGIITTPKIHHAQDLLKPSLSDLRSIVLTGKELQTLTETQFDQLYKYEEIVFARTTPEQKLQIVNEFKKRESVVAVTGDGVNDAPSLKAADCGIAMGNGSDVAKEAADMILLEDFSAIVVALEYGRLVFDNLQKTVLYLLPAGSFSELMPIVLNILIGVPQMLSNIQMIIICVATDVLPALSLCLEKPESGLLLRKPRNTKTQRLADWRLLLQAYGFLGIIESLCAMSMSFWYLQKNGVPFSNLVLGFGNWPGLDNELYFRAQSVYFFTLVLMQWGNLLATRGRRLSIIQHKPQSNWYIFPAAVLALCIGIFFCYVPWFQKVFQTRPIPVEHFFIPITFGIALLLLDEVRKLVVRTKPNGFISWLSW
ncbi:sodium-potassium ATPase [Cyathus striatus]|nr:sodium-potassium ATPase [Cyathus striatus]